MVGSKNLDPLQNRAGLRLGLQLRAKAIALATDLPDQPYLGHSNPQRVGETLIFTNLTHFLLGM